MPTSAESSRWGSKLRSRKTGCWRDSELTVPAQKLPLTAGSFLAPHTDPGQWPSRSPIGDGVTLPYSPDLDPVELLVGLTQAAALANFCAANIDELSITARSKLNSFPSGGPDPEA